MGRTGKEEDAMFSSDRKNLYLEGPAGRLAMPAHDDVGRKLAMLFEGSCTQLGPLAAAKGYGYSKQRFYQLRNKLATEGVAGLLNRKRGPKRKYRRTEAVEREVIRQRFLDPEAGAEVIAQKLRQTGHAVSVRSVERVIEEYGLSKKNFIGVGPRRTDR